MTRSTVRFACCLALLLLPAVAFAQQCLHGSDETVEQKARKREALGAARQVNTLQANHPDARQGKFLNQTEMAVYYADMTKQKGASRQSLIFDPASGVWSLAFGSLELGVIVSVSACSS